MLIIHYRRGKINTTTKDPILRRQYQGDNIKGQGVAAKDTTPK